MTDDSSTPIANPEFFPDVDTGTGHGPIMIEGLRPLLLGVSIIFVGFFVVDLIAPIGTSSVPVLIHDLFVAAACLVAWYGVKRRWWSSRWSNPFFAALALIVSSNSLLTAGVTKDAVYTVYLPIVIIAAGSFMVSYQWLLGTAAVIIVAWAPIAYPSAAPDQFVHYAVAMVATLVVAIAVMSARIRSMRRLNMARRREQRLKTEAEVALGHAERELKERKLAEAERGKLEEQLHHAQKMEAIGVLAGGVAHDMNNVLAVITTLSSVMVDDENLDSMTREDAAEMLDAANRGAALTSNLLGFARRGRYRRERVHVGGVLDTCVHLLKRSIPKKIEIKKICDPDLAAVEGDPRQLSEILMNLCINAIDAMGDEGVLTLEASNLILAKGNTEFPDLETGSYVSISVADTGCGMDERTLSRAFEPFFTTKARGQGTGLGLAMVYGAVESHGGRVRLDSELGRGTTATVLLPGLDAATETISTGKQRRADGAKAGTLLFVDDEPSLRRVGSQLLERLGYDVITASDGANALEMYQRSEKRIDLVILDMAMPVMDGTECFRKLRQVDGDLRILLSSGFAHHADTEALLAEGAVGFLVKPFNAKQLAQAVEAALAAD
ncbi:MAG: response regulator [Myxococcota bacterium]